MTLKIAFYERRGFVCPSAAEPSVDLPVVDHRVDDPLELARTWASCLPAAGEPAFESRLALSLRMAIDEGLVLPVAPRALRPAPAGSVRKQTDDERALDFMAKQYGNVLRRRLEALGGDVKALGSFVAARLPPPSRSVLEPDDAPLFPQGEARPSEAAPNH